MKALLLRRLFTLFPVVFGVVSAVFLLIHLIPGDPVEVMLGETSQPADREALRAQLHLDEPLGTQYVHFWKGLLTANLGVSLHSGRPVWGVVQERLPATIELALVAMVVALAMAFPIGILCAVRQGRALDHGAMMVALLGVSIPHFWLGPLLILAFSVYLGWMPIGGRDGLLSFVLPALTLGSGMAAILTRMVRASLLDVLPREYIRVARAKGVSPFYVLVRHAMANAMIPVVTVIALQFGALLAGTVITETVFSWPGLGRLLVEAIQRRDYPVVQGCVLVICFGYLFASFLADMLYAIFDPRIRYG